MFTLFKLSQLVANFTTTLGVLFLIAGLVFRFIPIIKSFTLPIVVVGSLLFSVGLYNQGKLSTEKEYKLKIAELEVKLKEAESRGHQVNTEIVTKIVTKREIIKTKGDDVIRYIDREVTKYDKSCEIPTVVIESHNLAAKNITKEEEKK